MTHGSGTSAATAKLTLESILALWTAQDGLLQQYRAIFIAVQAAMLSAAGLMVGSASRTPALVVLLAVALALVPVWVSSCNRRASIARAALYMLVKAEAGESIGHPMHYLGMAQSGNMLRLVGDPLVEEFSPPVKMSAFVFERVLPAVFLVAWAALTAAHFTTVLYGQAGG